MSEYWDKIHQLTEEKSSCDDKTVFIWGRRAMQEMYNFIKVGLFTVCTIGSIRKWFGTGYDWVIEKAGVIQILNWNIESLKERQQFTV